MTFVVEVWNVLLSLSLWLLIGAVVAGVLHVVLPENFVARHLRGRGAVLKAVALGVPLPLCSCGVIPAGLGLKRDGASDGAAVGFLISTPQTGVDSLLVSASFLGWPFALFKLVSATATGLIGGWLTDATQPPNAQPSATTSAASTGGKRGIREAWAQSIDILRSIWGWLAVGVLVSALITTYLPPQWLASVAAQGEFVSLLLALVVSLPLYVCATASVPIAAALVAAGLPPGAALVLLMAGPATNVATLGAVYRGLGRRALLIYLGTIVVGSLGLAYAFDFVLPNVGELVAHDHGQAAWYEMTAAVLLLGALLRFAFDDLRGWLQDRRQARTAAATSSTVGSETMRHFEVTGMTCGGCVRKLERALLANSAVVTAEVLLEPGRANVSGELDDDATLALIADAGFSGRVAYTPGPYD